MIAIMIEAALRGLLLAAAAGLGICIFRVKNIPARKAIWSIVLLSALAAPFVMRWKLPTRLTWALPLPAHLHLAGPAIQGSASPRMTIAGQTSSRAATTQIANTSFSHSSASGFFHIAPPPHGVAFYSAETSAGNPQFPLLRPALIAGITYFSVCCALLLRLIWGLFAAWRLWSTSEPISPIVVPYARIRASQSISSPVNIGSGVVLPLSFTNWPPERLRVVLAHERSHVRQLDFYLQLVARIYTALFWFSPLGWWLSRHLSALGEAISDRAGLSAASSRSAYAEIVLEFASKPRRILHQSSLGVAMACSGNVSNRIDRLLSENRLRIEFTEGRRRAWLAFLLVLAAALVTTSLIRIPAARAAQSAAPPPTPEQPAAPTSAQPSDQPLPQPSDTSQTTSPETAPPPPAAPPSDGISAPLPPPTPEPSMPQNNPTEYSYGYGFSTDGDSYAFVNGADSDITFSGNWNSNVKAEIEKARHIAHGKFLWFMHNGKSYVVDDPSVVARLEAMYKPMEELGRQQEELGKQQEALGKKQERLGDLQEQVSTPTPDLSKELADVQAALAKLEAAKGKTLTTEQLADIQEKIGELQGRLGELQGNVGTRAGSYGAEQGRLGERQGKLGEEQGRLGAQQGKLAMENESKVRSIIDESLHNGTARPVD